MTSDHDRMKYQTGQPRQPEQIEPGAGRLSLVTCLSAAQRRPPRIARMMARHETTRALHLALTLAFQ